ncbi:helix-turn-helix transcriptional regulator [Wenjunlia tyrosinilytica]|uniref:Helix-turn-helix transcriptional regulator n=1 Tax=Wenjunlia tyrosinilytica TaxID=1544741 RepID=A0A917ZS99_9ACTN|nr:helix-turn-helix transcriptional regulator [Wenjunlia tyrosinilytica]GGO92457.1 helix-turn-helix transcriptional regulator [Wenjunlia tyrosinilytica]
MTEEAVEIRAALLALRRTSGLPVAFGGTVTGQESLRIRELTGNATESLRGLSVVSGNGLGGKAVALARPFAVVDYRSARTISHEYDGAVTAEGLCSVVAVPVVVGRTVRAVLYGALRQPLPLGDRTISAVVAAARGLEQSLAVRYETERLLTRLDAPAAQPAWEEVRQVHSELRALAGEIEDARLRARLHGVCSRLASASATPGDHPVLSGRPGLSPRETDVLALVATGCTNTDAAERLGLRMETVKSYLRSAMRKLGTHTRLEAVVTARRAGLLP